MLGYLGRFESAEEARNKISQGYGFDDLIGRAGLELRYEDLLRGEDGQIIEERIISTDHGVQTISFALASAGHVSVTVFDVEGRVVKTLNNTVLPAGRQHLVWEGDDNRGQRVAPGLYFANTEAGGKRSTAKMVVLR